MACVVSFGMNSIGMLYLLRYFSFYIKIETGLLAKGTISIPTSGLKAPSQQYKNTQLSSSLIFSLKIVSHGANCWRLADGVGWMLAILGGIPCKSFLSRAHSPLSHSLYLLLNLSKFEGTPPTSHSSCALGLC
jgi:hypothetical protein